MVATNDLKALLVPTRLRRGVDENQVQPFRTPEKRPESNRKALQKDQDPTYRRASVRTGEFCKRLRRYFETLNGLQWRSLGHRSNDRTISINH
jgi:hypothetical protein